MIGERAATQILRILLRQSLLLYAVMPCAAQRSQVARSPRDWAVEAAANEIVMLRHTDSYLCYRMHVVDGKGDQTRDVIESKDGTVARLILRDGKPLTPEEDTAEHQRLNDLVASPAEFLKHIRSEGSGKTMAEEMLRLMPNAMIYTYSPTRPPSDAEHAGEVVIDYYPNPVWTPPSMTAEALTGLKGRIWMDGKTHQMLRMEAEIFKPVNFGWGMLAHLYPGGHLLLEQTDAGNGRWIYKRFTEQVSVRALMVKQMNVHAEVSASEFHAVGPMSYQEAIRTLLATPLPSR